jgi:multiple sugar transport system substrate-binding protein
MRKGGRVKRIATLLALVALSIGVAACSDDDSGGSGSGGKVEIKFWHGQTQGPAKLLGEMVDEFNSTHPNIKVSKDFGGVNSDRMLTKVTAGLQAGSYPDIAYIYGSDLANLAKSDKLVDLTDKKSEIEWDKFFPAAQGAATVDGRIRAFPALIDNLAVVYNKKIFDDAGVAYPKDDWTWEDFRATAAKLNDPDKGIAGAAWPGTGDEDTTWRIWPLIWQQGGDVLAEDGKSVGFDNPEGEAALQVVADLASDDSLYIDNTAGSERMQQLFTSGKMAMNIAGPWALPEYVDGKIDYGVAPLPSFGGEHTTIAGPDTWAIFDNGDAKSKAAIEFVSWLTAPKQQIRWLSEAGSLPTRTDMVDLPGYADYEKSLPELDKFVDNLELARIRPTVAAYPQISQAMGKAIASVLQGKSQPADALSEAADAANSELNVPGG